MYRQFERQRCLRFSATGLIDGVGETERREPDAIESASRALSMLRHRDVNSRPGRAIHEEQRSWKPTTLKFRKSPAF
jgi:hypothetical protein